MLTLDICIDNAVRPLAVPPVEVDQECQKMLEWLVGMSRRQRSCERQHVANRQQSADWLDDAHHIDWLSMTPIISFASSG
jgi:hypothetical protein